MLVCFVSICPGPDIVKNYWLLSIVITMQCFLSPISHLPLPFPLPAIALSKWHDKCLQNIPPYSLCDTRYLKDETWLQKRTDYDRMQWFKVNQTKYPHMARIQWVWATVRQFPDLTRLAWALYYRHLLSTRGQGCHNILSWG